MGIGRGPDSNGGMKAQTVASFGLRILFALTLIPVLGFCVFGMLATFEPLPAVTQWLWRGIYGSVGAASLLGIAGLLLPLGRKAG